MEKPDPIRASTLQSEGINHGFFTRDGGVSKGIYQGLNVGLGSDDNRQHVEENRERVAENLQVQPNSLLTVYQVHSPDAVTVHEPWQSDTRPQADAMVTNTPDLAIGVLTADCGPVLFCDAENKVIGAAHSGWKGATGGVLENTISAMEKLGAKRGKIHAVLGPTISKDAYEVGPEFVERLVTMDKANETYLSASKNINHAMFDLPAYILNRLQNSGVTAEWTGQCTYADENRLFSYRRKTHRNEHDYGRQISAIKINS